MVDKNLTPEIVYVSKELEEEKVREENEVEVLHEDVDVPEDLSIPEELVWTPAGEIAMRNIMRLELDKTGDFGE